MSEPSYDGNESLADGVPIAVVVTAVAAADVLAGTLRLAGKSLPPGAVVVPTGGGAVVAAELDAERSDTLAATVSLVLRDVPVILLTREGGQLSATRWAAGSPGEPLPPGLVMTNLDDVVEGLLLGHTAPVDAAGAIEVARLGRWRAARMVASARRSG